MTSQMQERPPAIDLSASPTPNVLKVAIMLEETGLTYRLVPITDGDKDRFPGRGTYAAQ